MKKAFTLVCALLLGATLSLAQSTSGSPGEKTGTSATKGKKHHHHKHGKRSKKGSAATNTGGQPPK
ncbi:MAG TPA: hypothetical protein VKY85_11955 [Candidatus Angelobacter sp.]|nr:hypothetical protein [Candidatus Angelobacter sp.]